MISRIAKYIFRIVLTFVSLIVVYLLWAYFAAFIPVNSEFSESGNGIDIYIISNGVHTDICLPLDQIEDYWSQMLNYTDFDGKPETFKYISFGWGDKGFYLNTPNWSDLKFTTAFKAAFLPSTTAMHVSMYDFQLSESDNIRKVKIDNKQFKKLQSLIIQSFRLKEGKAIYIPGYRYPNLNDNFYEARGSYSLFKTCNSWTNTTLKNTGVKTSLWSPFDWGIMKQLEKNNK